LCTLLIYPCVLHAPPSSVYCKWFIETAQERNTFQQSSSTLLNRQHRKKSLLDGALL
jgi:hypothetical protein